MEQTNAKPNILHRLVTRVAVIWASSRRRQTQGWYEESVAAYEAAREHVDEEYYLFDPSGRMSHEELQLHATEFFAIEFLSDRLRFGLIFRLRELSRLFDAIGVCRLLKEADWIPAATTLLEQAKDRHTIAGRTTLPVIV